MNTGIRWAWGLLDGLLRGAAVLVLVAAVALPSFLTHRPAWESLAVAGVLLLAIFAEGSYRVWQTADEQLVGDEDESQGEPVSDEHRKDLQAIAEHLLGGVKRADIASFLADGDERINLAIAFTEHFPNVSQSVIDWGRLIANRDKARQELHDWIEQQLSDMGFTGSAFAATVAREAESPKPHFLVDRGEVQVGSGNRLALDIGHMQDAAEQEPALRELFERVGAQPACSRIAKALAEIRSVQTDLADDLELIRDKTTIRGRCKLCS